MVFFAVALEALVRSKRKPKKWPRCSMHGSSCRLKRLGAVLGAVIDLLLCRWFSVNIFYVITSPGAVIKHMQHLCMVVKGWVVVEGCYGS